jgi:hypothetical protein
MEDNLLNSALSITRPIIELAVTLFAPILIGWLSVKLAAVLNIKEEKDKVALERSLRDALHASALNALSFALQRAGVNASTAALLKEAVGYVKDKNPEALTKLGVDDLQLREIIMSKLPPPR